MTMTSTVMMMVLTTTTTASTPPRADVAADVLLDSTEVKPKADTCITDSIDDGYNSA